MPNRKDENGIFRDIIHPIDNETRDDFELIILSAYEDYIALEDIMSDKEVWAYAQQNGYPVSFIWGGITILLKHERTEKTTKITKAEIQEIFSEGETKALVTVMIDDCLMIRNFRIIKKPNGTLIGMPTFTDEKGDHAIVLISNNELTKELGEAVIAAYNNFVKGLDSQNIKCSE